MSDCFWENKKGVVCGLEGAIIPVATVCSIPITSYNVLFDGFTYFTSYSQATNYTTGGLLPTEENLIVDPSTELTHVFSKTICSEIKIQDLSGYTLSLNPSGIELPALAPGTQTGLQIFSTDGEAIVGELYENNTPTGIRTSTIVNIHGNPTQKLHLSASDFSSLRQSGGYKNLIIRHGLLDGSNNATATLYLRAVWT